MKYLTDIVKLLFSWRLARVIRKFGMPHPGDTLLISDPLVRQFIVHNGIRVAGVAPVPILFCEDVNNIQSLPFEELCYAVNQAWLKLQESQGVKPDYTPQRQGNEGGQSSSREEGGQQSFTN